jgi:hypothetical protein
MDESLDGHFTDYDDCAASFSKWDRGPSSVAPATDASGPGRAQQAVAWVLIGIVMLYALLVQGSILLGVIASGIIFVASRIDWTSVA